MSQFRYILGQSSTLTVNRAYIPTAYNIDPGNDILAYDKQLERYVGIKGDTYDPTVAGFTDRYDTNNDIIVGVTGGYIHACACSDSGTLYGNTAASHCFSKLTLPAEVLNGTKAFDLSTGGYSRTFTGTVDTIVAKMKDSSNNGGFGASGSNTYTNTFFVEKLDSSTIGIGRGSYQLNALVITYDGSTFSHDGTYNNLVLEDMTRKATNTPGVLNGDDYNDSYTRYANTAHKDFRAISCTNTGMTSPSIPSSLGPVSSCYCNTGVNYSYRSGINYAGFRSWAGTSGDSTFLSDGVNGSSTSGTAGKVMNMNTFDANVKASATGDAKKMYDYYYELLNSTDLEIKAKRESYESMYAATMNNDTMPLYAAYLMSHMINVNTGSGVTAVYRNHGKEITDIKGKTMNVDYNDKYVPAYPPEYQALQYGNNDPESKFKKGSYYHPEPYDIGLIMRDDILAKFNSRINSLNTNFGIAKTNLANTNYLGTCAEYNANRTWLFAGHPRVLALDTRNTYIFHSRPFFACLNS